MKNLFFLRPSKNIKFQKKHSRPRPFLFQARPVSVQVLPVFHAYNKGTQNVRPQDSREQDISKTSAKSKNREYGNCKYPRHHAFRRFLGNQYRDKKSYIYCHMNMFYGNNPYQQISYMLKHKNLPISYFNFFKISAI